LLLQENDLVDSYLGVDVLRYLDEVSVAIPKIDGTNAARSAGFRHRIFDYRYSAIFQMLINVI
jgi:hypothetical protein